MSILSTALRDADTLLHLVPPVVRLDDRLPAIVRSAAADPVARCAFVVDAAGRLAGVVPVEELDRGMLLLVAPESAPADRITVRSLTRLAHGTHETARHLMREAATVRLGDTVATALRRIEEHRLESAAVLDDEGCLLGYVAVFEILAEALMGPPSPVRP